MRFVKWVGNGISALRQNLKTVYGFRDERALGRLCMTSSGILSSLASLFTSGAFYAGFLLLYGFDVTNIGIVTFIPSIMSLANIFSPSILERFRRRKWLLAGVRIFTYIINILGITFLPVLVTGTRARVIGIVCLVCFANGVSNLFGSGYSAWHAKFLPDEVRANYFMTNSCINSFLNYIIVLFVSIVADSLAGSPKQLDFLVLIRVIAFTVAVADTLLLCIPKEYPYETSGAKVKLSDIFTKPVKNKPFLFSMIILFLYGFTTNLPNATLNAWLLDDVGITYTFMNGINATYFLFFIAFGKMWNRFIAHFTWFRALAYGCLMVAVTYFAYGFLTVENASWLYLGIRLTQHVFGTVMNTIIASIPYINLPDEDRTNYLSFQLIVSSMAAFTGMMTGTLVTKWMGASVLSVLGFSFTATPVMLFACSLMHIVTALFIFRVLPVVTPKGHYPAPSVAKKRRKAPERAK